MTQEELDELMKSEDNLILDAEEKHNAEEKQESLADDSKELIVDGVISSDYKASEDMLWPPPPPNQEHKVVHQLDDVTKDSEKKAIELMDKLEVMGDYFSECEKLLSQVNAAFVKNVEIFSKLNAKFPNIQTFSESLALNTNIQEETKKIKEKLQAGGDEVMMAMDAMQYQDIHRQKIERVINVMRALSRYMSSLFEGKIDDSKRVSSAVHITGDSTEDVVSNDDIEALIASLGQKK